MFTTTTTTTVVAAAVVRARGNTNRVFCSRRQSGSTTCCSFSSSSSSGKNEIEEERRSAFASRTRYPNDENERTPRGAKRSGNVGFSRGAILKTRASSEGLSDSGAEPWDPSEHDGALDPIRNEVLLQIVQSELSDEEVNKLVWQCLGYEMEIELDPETLTATEKWKVSDKVFPNWAKRFPEPPDVIGVTRKYYPEIDQPVKEACASLTRSVASEYKNGLKEQLRPLGWKGFKMEGLTPNMTRRAQAANWLVYYRSELRGVPIEELKRRREVRRLKEIEDGEEKKPTGGSAQSVV
jgi:hypothetical protein